MLKNSMSRSLITLLMIAPIVALAFLSVWQRNEIIQVGYEIGTLQKERKRLRQAQRELRAEVENLTAVERIEQIASNQLGMEPPKPEQIVFLRDRSGERVKENVSEKE